MFNHNNTIINNDDYLYKNAEDNKIKNDLDAERMELTDSDRLSNPIFKSIGYPSKIYL